MLIDQNKNRLKYQSNEESGASYDKFTYAKGYIKWYIIYNI